MLFRSTPPKMLCPYGNGTSDTTMAAKRPRAPRHPRDFYIDALRKEGASIIQIESNGFGENMDKVSVAYNGMHLAFGVDWNRGPPSLLFPRNAWPSLRERDQLFLFAYRAAHDAVCVPP